MARPDYEAAARSWLDNAQKLYETCYAFADDVERGKLAAAIAQVYATLELAWATDGVASKTGGI